jgi:hypothetical protein
MRFRSKIGAMEGFYLVMAGFSVLMWVNFRHLKTFDYVGWSWVLLAAVSMFSRAFIYWDTDSSGLTEQRFWRKKHILWQRVTKVGPDRLGGLRIEFTMQVPAAKPSRITADPANRMQFMAMVHEFAPQAEIDDAPRAELIG